MKTKSKVILAVILTLVLIVGWFIYKQWNNIEAILLSADTNQEDTVRKLEKNKEELQNFLESEKNISVRDLTEEEAKALQEGNLTEEEVVELLTGGGEPGSFDEEDSVEQKTPPDEAEKEPSKATKNPEQEKTSKPATGETANPTQKPTEKPVATQSPKPQTSVSTSDQKVEQLIAKLYVQKSTYLGKLGSIESQARSEYLSLRYGGTDKQTAQQQIVKKYLSQVSSWETTCDNTVNGILNEIRTELSKSGKDTSIVDTMKNAYLEEKKLKKAYFINRYMD